MHAHMLARTHTHTHSLSLSHTHTHKHTHTERERKTETDRERKKEVCMYTHKIVLKQTHAVSQDHLLSGGDSVAGGIYLNTHQHHEKHFGHDPVQVRNECKV